MKRSIVFAAALASLAVFAASTAAAQEKEVKVTVIAEDEARPERAPKLTEEQRAMVEELRTEHRLRTIELRADLQKLGVELRRETAKNQPDMKAVEAALKKMSAVRERLQMSRIEHGVAMRKLLGDDWRRRAGRAPDTPGMMRVGAEEAGCRDHGEGDVCVYRFRGGESARGGRTGRRIAGMPAIPHAKTHECFPGAPVVMKHPRAAAAPKAACHPREAGGAKVVCVRSMSKKVCDRSCASHRNNWDGRMFRPRGKKTEHRCVCAGRHVEWRHEMPAEGRRTRSSGGR